MSRDDIEIHNLALAGELAHQVRHDLSNLVNNLMLQGEICQAHPSNKPESWTGVVHEGKELLRLLQEWDRFNGRFCYTERQIDLNDLIRQVARDLAAHDTELHVKTALSAKPLEVVSAPVAVRHLLRLLIEDALPAEASGESRVTIETYAEQTEAMVRITVSPGLQSVASSSLTQTCCRSLAVRLDVSVHQESPVSGPRAIQVVFPLHKA